MAKHLRIPINGKTRLAGVIGWPIQHTLSPAMHNAAFAHLGIDAVYLPLGVPEEGLSPLLKTLKNLDALGVNVTVPYKETVIPFLDESSERAKRIGAVNTIIFDQGRLIGHNTDGPGFLASLRAKIRIPGKAAVVLGTGGAGRAAAVSLAEAGIKILTLTDVDPLRMQRLAQDLGGLGTTEIRTVESQSAALQTALSQADLLVQATPLGLNPRDPLPIPEEWMPQKICVMDLVYGHGLTPFLKWAQKKKNTLIPGWLMLLHQGVEAFRLWTRQAPPVAIMKKALISAGGFKTR